MLKTALRLAAISFVVFPVSVSAQPVQFSTHRDYPSGYGPASIATGDVNGDGIRDLAVANRLDDSVAVLLGNADGSFQRPVSVYLGPNSSPCSVGIGDFNRDGRLDLAVANSGANTVSILPGNGDGTFQPALSLAAGTGPASLAVADFNGDGKSDLAVANTGSNDLSIILGNGDGTFQPAQRWVTDAGPSFVAVADFNRDTKPDLAVVNSGSGTISVLLGNGDGTFQAPSTFGAGGTHVGSIAVGDFNGDGAQDLAVTNTDANTVSVLAGNGDGTFQPLRDFDAGQGGPRDRQRRQRRHGRREHGLGTRRRRRRHLRRAARVCRGQRLQRARGGELQRRCDLGSRRRQQLFDDRVGVAGNERWKFSGRVDA
ncbi:MAG: hypothetical protein DMF86_13505 [Acidobacteria bacterium]|nr:MAG: hypothetical protein DMF86_13505 [Acidobacteriota bacterium]